MDEYSRVYKKDNKRKQLCSRIEIPRQRGRWEKPEIRCIKVNCDASWSIGVPLVKYTNTAGD